MSTPPNVSTTRTKAPQHRGRLRDVAFHARAPSRRSVFAWARAAFSSTSSSAHLGAGGGEGARRRRADHAAGSGDHRDLAGQRLFRLLAELRLLERPVLHVEHVGFVDQLEAAERLRIGDGLDRRFGEVGGDARVLLAAPEPDQPEAGDQRPRAAADRAAACAARSARCGARNRPGSSRHRRAPTACASRLNVVELTVLRRRHDQRPVLGADRVVRRHHAGLAVARDLGAIDEIEDRRAGAEIEDEAAPGAFVDVVLEAAGAAHDRRDVAVGGEALGQGAGDEHRIASAREPRLGERDHLDHALVGFPRARAEGEDAVLVQDQAFDVALRLVDFGRLLGEAEARHDVRHHAHAAVVDLGADLRPVRLVDQAQDRVGVGVIDEGVRHERVQQRLDRRVGGHRIDQVGALDPHHLFVRQRVERAQLAQGCEPHGGKAGGLDRRHVPAAALDAEDLGFLAHQIGNARLDGGVAAAVQHQLRILAEEAGRIDAQAQIAPDAQPGILIDGGLRLAIDPATFHQLLLPVPTPVRACPRLAAT